MAKIARVMPPMIAAVKAVEDNAEVSRQILARLDALDARVAAVEKKLTRVP